MKRQTTALGHRPLIVALALVVGVAPVVGNQHLNEPPAPTPSPAPSVPAPLPPATGIDGDGLAAAPHQAAPDGLPADPEQLPPDVQAQPDAGAPALVVETPRRDRQRSTISSPAFRGRAAPHARTPGSIGTLHGAWDIGIDRGTKIYAARTRSSSGRHDGFAATPAVAPTPSAARPSNWGSAPGQRQQARRPHTSTSRLEKQGQAGQKVKQDPVARAFGNTGNSTGDHLHLSASTSPWAAENPPRLTAPLDSLPLPLSPSARIFAPSKFWSVPKPPRSSAPRRSPQPAVPRAGRPASSGSKALGIPPTNDVCTTEAARRLSQSTSARSGFAARLRTVSRQGESQGSRQAQPGWRVTP